jgi:hypothetical protein
MDCTGVCRHKPCPECEGEPRASRMPEGVEPIPPYTEPKPEDIEEKEGK